jgi:hypothetical protein
MAAKTLRSAGTAELRLPLCWHCSSNGNPGVVKAASRTLQALSPFESTFDGSAP